MAPPPDVDPRTATEQDVRPTVAGPSAGVPWWVGIGAILLVGLLLFALLDARRRAASAPAVAPEASDTAALPAAGVPPLAIPPEPAPPPPAPPHLAVAVPIASSPPPPPRFVYPSPPAAMMPQPPVLPPPARSADPALVIDTTAGDVGDAGAAPGGSGAAAGGMLGASARATIMHHRPTTVPQGTLIPAVLETALDSTRLGPARAHVSEDVRGFDGTTILIRRGSRLIGEYRADVQSGQNRALVMWTRLVQPDGTTIAIGSPAADPLGAVGIRGRVDSHFLARFSGAILQTALDVGITLASRIGNSNSVALLALPGSLSGSSAALGNTQTVQPTLHVKPGTAISVFVARDLDFTGVEHAR